VFAWGLDLLGSSAIYCSDFVVHDQYDRSSSQLQISSFCLPTCHFHITRLIKFHMDHGHIALDTSTSRIVTSNFNPAHSRLAHQKALREWYSGVDPELPDRENTPIVAMAITVSGTHCRSSLSKS